MDTVNEVILDSPKLSLVLSGCSQYQSAVSSWLSSIIRSKFGNVSLIKIRVF